jgi:hypothetical protein
MEMLLRTLSILVIIGTLFATARQADAELTKLEIGYLLEDFLTKDLEAGRKAEIIKILQTGTTQDKLRKDLERAFVIADQRPRVLELATGVPVTGLFKKIKICKDIEGADEVAMMEYLFATQDPGAPEWLYARWKSKPTDSDSFKIVNTKFGENFIPVDVTKKFYEYLTEKDADPDRRIEARRIVLYQMDEDPEDSLVQIDSAWREFLSESAKNMKTFSLRGHDILQMANLKFYGKVRKMGLNYKLYPGSSIELDDIPDFWQKIRCFLKGHMRLISGDGATVALCTDAASPGPLVRDQHWTITPGRGRAEAVNLGEWQKFEIYYEYDSSSAAAPYTRRCHLTLEGKFNSHLTGANGKFTKLRIAAGESTVVISSLKLEEKKS